MSWAILISPCIRPGMRRLTSRELGMASALIDTVRAGGDARALMASPVPDSYRAAFLRRQDESIFDGAAERDVRATLRVGEVPMPELAPDEVLVAVMASAINYNTVWSAKFLPVSTFSFLKKFGRESAEGARHDLDRHILGSDGAGVVVRTGAAVRHWKIGDHIVIGTLHTDEQDPISQWDGMLSRLQRAWGYETNFGGLAHYAIVKATQLLPKPAHLTWEEAGCNTLCLMTAYRMLISTHGARVKL